MFFIAAGIFIGLSAYSLYSTIMSWRAVRTGRVHIDVIRDLTGRIDKSEITGLFGNPDAALSYPVSPGGIKKARAPFCVLLSSEIAQIILIAALGYVLFEGSTPLGWIILAAAGAYILTGYILAAYLIAAHMEQLEDEIESGSFS